MSSQQNNFSVELNTNNECFIGNLNKQKTRDEIFQDLTSIEIIPLKENLYISKFNMPKFNARKDQNGNLLLNLGYAFVTTKKPEMAQWLIQQKRIELPDGSDIEIKPISKTKRLTANQNCKNKNFSKINGNEDLNERYTQKPQLGAIGDRRGEKQMRYGSNDGSRENMYENGYDSNNLFGGYNDSSSNSLNNSTANNSYFNPNMHDNQYRYSEPTFLLGSNNSGNVNSRGDSGSSLFNTRVSQSEEFIQVPSLERERNFAPASIDYKKVSPKVSPKNLWNPFFGPQTDSDSNNNNFALSLSRQASENSKNSKSSSNNGSTHFSPTNGEQSFTFHNSINRNI